MGESTAAALTSGTPSAGSTSAGSTAAALISGTLSAGSTIIGGILQARENEKNRKVADQWNTLQYKNELEAQQAARSFAERGQKFTEKESALNRAERTEQKGYDRVQAAYKRAADLLNQNQVMLANRTAPLIRKA